MSKRKLVIDETAPFLFTLPNGKPVDEKKLFSRYRDELETVILSAPNAFRIVGLFEQASKQAAGWIRKQYIWRKLFARDFPVEYAVAFDVSGPGQMRASHAQELDSISVQSKERTWTLWKRYYEYIVKLKSIATWHPFNITTDHMKNYEWGMLIEEFNASESHMSEQQKSEMHILRMTHIAYPTAEILKQNRQVVCYISSKNGTENFVVLQPSLHKFKFEKIAARVTNILYEIMEFEEPEFDGWRDYHYVITPDRFSAFRLDFGRSHNTSNQQITALHEASLVYTFFLEEKYRDFRPFKLVSSCLQCDKEAKWHWENMPEYRFCSEPCARIAWAERMKK